MSSETSTDALQPWQLFTLAGLIGATAVVYSSRGQTPASIVLLSLTIFAAAAVGLAAWRAFSPLTESGSHSGPQMLGGRTRAALEREKALVLRSIKELEFDHAMHKVSDKDYAEMGARLRVRAAGLIRQMDAAATYREQIETEIAARVGRTLSGAPHDSPVGRTLSGSPGDGPVGRALSGSPDGPDKVRPTTTTRQCSTCATENDADAQFCKRCGNTLSGTA